MTKQNNESAAVQSVDRALVILEFLKENVNGLGVTELANRLDVAKSTVHRLLSSLAKHGYVRKDKVTEKYLLSLKLIELGNVVSQSLDVRRVASEYLQKLVDEIGETAHLVVMEDGEIVYIDKVESKATIRMYSQIGRRAPVHCTGAGKAMLAYLPNQEINEILDKKGLRKFTEKTLITKETVLRDLDEIREKGYSVDNEEHELGIRCIGAPIFDYTGKVVAGLSVTGPLMRMTDKKMKEYKKIVTAYAGEISRKLGYKD